MSIYKKPVHQLMVQFAEDKQIKKGQTFTRTEVVDWFETTFPKVKRATINTHLIKMSTNAPSRVHHKVQRVEDDLFFQIDRSHFRLYDEEKDPKPIYPSDLPEENGSKIADNTEEPSEPAEHTISRRTIGDEPTEKDTLGFEPYVNAVTDFLTAPATRPPLTLSIEGEWGSGKSSFMQQLRVKLEGEKFQQSRKNRDRLNLTVEFNPWRHDKEDALWAAFALHFIKEISEQLSFTARWRARIRLLRTRYDWKDGWFDCVKALSFSIAVASIIIALPLVLIFKGAAWLTFLVSWVPDKYSWSKTLSKWLAGLGSAGTMMGGLIALWGKFKDYLANPLSFDLRKHLKSPDYAARISFVENFHRDFKKIVDAYSGQKQTFVFIDDLDRCDVPKAADLLQAINLMISSDPRLFFIIGMDREKVAAGLAVKFEKVIPYFATEVKPHEQAIKTRGGLEFGYTFIEKFIQIPFLVPQPKADKLDTLLGLGQRKPGTIPQPLQRDNVKNLFQRLRLSFSGRLRKSAAEDDTPTEIRDADLPPEQRASRQMYRFKVSENDSETLGEIVSWVAPFLDANPRRIKQFINLFRLRVLIANETGLFDANGKGEALTMWKLAKFVVITLRWPLFLRDLEVDQYLLENLATMSEDEVSESSDVLVKRWHSRTRLMDFLQYIPLEATDGYGLTDLDVAKLLQVSPRVRGTDVLTTPESEEIQVNVQESIQVWDFGNFQKNNIDLQGHLYDLAQLLTERGNKEVAKELENAAKALEQAENIKSKEEVKKIGIANRLRRLVEALEDEDSRLHKTVKGIKNGVSIAQNIGKGYNDIAQWAALPQVPSPFLKIEAENVTFNFRDCNIGLQGNLNDLAQLLTEGGNKQEAKELASAAKALEQAKDCKSIEEVKKKGIANRLRRLVEALEDEDSMLHKTVKGIKNGINIAQDIGKGYNDLAQWAGLPQVPKPFLKSE